MSLAAELSFSTFMVYSALSLTLALGIYQMKHNDNQGRLQITL